MNNQKLKLGDKVYHRILQETGIVTGTFREGVTDSTSTIVQFKDGEKEVSTRLLEKK